MSGEPAEIIGNQSVKQHSDGWDPSDNPVFREFLDHLAEILAQDYVQRMRETADPYDLKAWENGGPG